MRDRMARFEVIARPLPDIPGHVVKAVSISGKHTHRGRAFVAIVAKVLPRELALPSVWQNAHFRRELVPPNERLSIEAAA
jgi:hypothetical protein